MSGKLQNRVILITGAERGIGRAAAELLAGEGAKVVVTGILDADGEAVVAAITAAGGTAIYVHHDVSSEASWEAVIARSFECFGGLDGLVNNAGMFIYKPIADTSDAEYDRMQAINVDGPWLGMKHAMTAMARTGRGGAIVNVSSLNGLVGEPNAIGYCGTKGAVTVMTKCAALEGAAMSPQIRVNSLHPGVIWTDMLIEKFGGDPNIKQVLQDGTPLRMLGTPEYMADGILFLLSDDASFMTGAELVIDGGRGAD